MSRFRRRLALLIGGLLAVSENRIEEDGATTRTEQDGTTRKTEGV